MRASEISRPGRRVGALQLGIILTTLATALIHLYLAAQPDEDLRVWFFLNGIGYIVLLIGLFLPQLASQHRLLCYALMGYATLTIILWLILGQPYDTLGFTTKGIELILIGLLFPESRHKTYSEREQYTSATRY